MVKINKRDSRIAEYIKLQISQYRQKCRSVGKVLLYKYQANESWGDCVSKQNVALEV